MLVLGVFGVWGRDEAPCPHKQVLAVPFCPHPFPEATLPVPLEVEKQGSQEEPSWFLTATPRRRPECNQGRATAGSREKSDAGKAHESLSLLIVHW
jgi:hypothetical protein